MRYLPLLILALAWEAAARFNLVSSLAQPPLSHVAAAWLDLARDGELADTAAPPVSYSPLSSAAHWVWRWRRGGRSICF
jgi:NitT/TauT family transport system permease protein